MIKLITNRTRKTTNKILAIEADVPATTVNPNAPEIKAMIKNVKAQPSMIVLLIRVDGLLPIACFK